MTVTHLQSIIKYTLLNPMTFGNKHSHGLCCLNPVEQLAVAGEILRRLERTRRAEYVVSAPRALGLEQGIGQLTDGGRDK